MEAELTSLQTCPFRFAWRSDVGPKGRCFTKKSEDSKSWCHPCEESCIYYIIPKNPSPSRLSRIDGRKNHDKSRNIGKISFLGTSDPEEMIHMCI